VAFDRFWRSLVSGLALNASPAVAVQLVPPHASVGDRVRVVARVRPLERDRLKDALSVSARVGSREAIRLWPDAPDGVFTGSFVVDAAHGQSPLVTVTIDGAASGSARLGVESRAREAVGPPLSLLAATRGGVDAGPEDLARLERQLRAVASGASSRTTRHPMQSTWWLVPFCTALSFEWWLRRRRGAR
jgi:hypothetical protein